MPTLDGTMQVTDNTKKFTELFSELEHCIEDEQRKKIGEMNDIVDGMNYKEFKSVFVADLFNEIDKMIEKEKLSMENAILLLKHVGYLCILRHICILDFEFTLLNERFKKMIITEEKKKEEKDENLFVDLIECYLLLYCHLGNLMKETKEICFPCLLKAALKKEKSEVTQKDVEIALLALCCMSAFNHVGQELYLNKITEIIKYHQEHLNLTRLAYQSAWRFFIFRLWSQNSLEGMIVNDLCFAREASRELEELSKCVNWKRKEENGRMEVKEVIIIRRWLIVFRNYFEWCTLWNEELVGLMSSIVQLFRAARDNYREICIECLYMFVTVAGNRAVEIDGMLKGRVIDTIFEEIQRPTLIDVMAFQSLTFFDHISSRLKRKKDDKMEEAKRKELKRKVFEKLEEGVYEDITVCLCGVISFLNKKYNDQSSLNISNFFVIT
ncbi:uncharacterized protein MONOS_17286 [Monocercomonoides exilis]|uniref:uncharacterized protein n=1 Tax=Monocercomonoides exilis TaxID=2049356 RepID=UPI003559BC80|nr:hypothetical protein MONOS_17286 [Monocercomonoides exilis]